MKIYQSSINMGFLESVSMIAVQKFGENINECINHIESNNDFKQNDNNNHNQYQQQIIQNQQIYQQVE